MHIDRNWLLSGEGEPYGEKTKVKDGVTILERLHELQGLQKQNDFAAYVGLPASTYCTIINGRELSERQAKRIAEACNVGLDWLLYGDEEQKDDPINDKVLDWLRHHPEERKRIHEAMARETHELPDIK